MTGPASAFATNNSPQRSAILMGYYGVNNLGDELMLYCLRRWLESKDIAITVLSEAAAHVAQTHRVKAEQNYALCGQFDIVSSWIYGRGLRLIPQIMAHDLFLAGGGDIIRDNTGWPTFLFQVEKLILSVLLGKPVYLINVGISRPRTWYGRAILKWLIPRCTGILARDHRTVNMCREYGSRPNSLEFTPDIVFSLPRFVPPRSTVQSNTLIVALHGRPNIYQQFNLNAARLRILANALDELIEAEGLRVRFLASQVSEREVDDHDMHRAVLCYMRHAGKADLIPWTADPQTISDLFASTRFVIAMRLHAAILAAAYKVRCVVLPYDSKVLEFARIARNVHIAGPATLDDSAWTRFLLANALHGPAPHSPVSGVWTDMTPTAETEAAGAA